MNDELLPLNHIARRLRVPSRWLKAEAQAGRIPALNAGGVLLADPDAVRAALLSRLPREAESEVTHAAC